MNTSLFLLRSSIVGALGGLLFGFDTAVIAGATNSLSQTFQLGAAALGFTVSSALWGTVISAMFAGIPGEKIGARDALRITALLYVVSAIGCAFAFDWWTLIAFRFIGGLAIGASSVLGPIYIAELAPAKWRGRLVGLFQVNIVVGILLAYFSNYIIGLQQFGLNEWRWQLGVSGILAIFFLAMLFGIPRSPRWLVSKNHTAEALSVLHSTGIENPEQELQSIENSLGMDKLAEKEPLFNRRYMKPILLALSIGIFNQLSGINAILYYLNDIFAQAGFSKMSSDLQAVAIGLTNLICTLAAMTVIDRFGRKPLLLTGAIGTAFCLFGVAAVFYTHQHQAMLLWFLVGFIAFFAISQGAVIWVYLSEIFPTRVRARGQSLGCSAHWIMNAIISGVFPVLAKTSGAVPFAFFGLMMLLQFVAVLFFYPETKQISLEKLQESLGLSEEKSVVVHH
ncbi:MAG: sugar porter family MFS transporter [Candidatus Obscuribacterales bacterium]|nr:sugar porter family MFS transporter [Candidatus Obscuribacterales bacterium]